MREKDGYDMQQRSRLCGVHLNHVAIMTSCTEVDAIA